MGLSHQLILRTGARDIWGLQGHHLQDGVIGCGCFAAFPFKYPMPDLALFEGEHILDQNTFAGERLDFRNGKFFSLLLTLPYPSFFLPFGKTWMYT